MFVLSSICYTFLMDSGLDDDDMVDEDDDDGEWRSHASGCCISNSRSLVCQDFFHFYHKRGPRKCRLVGIIVWNVASSYVCDMCVIIWLLNYSKHIRQSMSFDKILCLTIIKWSEDSIRLMETYYQKILF